MNNKDYFKNIDRFVNYKIGGRGFGKMFEIQKTLTILMTRNSFSIGKFKATTVIKFEKWDDIYILYGNELKCVESKKAFELVGKTSLYSIAQFYQSIFITSQNSFYGGLK